MFRILVWIVLPISLLLVFVYITLSKSLPTVQGRLPLDGLIDGVTVSRDAHSIPDIRANTDLDAYFALGFVHAQDRLWQMEMNRREGNGRLSEVLGRSTLGSDTMMRSLGLRLNAKRIWNRLGAKDKEILASYVKGVNAGIAKMAVPIEYHLLNFQPEPWLPEDTLVLMQLMSWKYGSNLSAEVERFLLLNQHGAAVANEVMPGSLLDVEKQIAAPTGGPSRIDALAGRSHLFAPAPAAYTGSNSWVVSGKYTASGLAMLASDPHLAMPIPSIWYLASVRGALLDVSGATMPGLPFFLIGKNKDIAWGATNAKADTQDLVLEEINPFNKNEYKTDGAFVPMQIINEQVAVKNDALRPARNSERITIRRTHNGLLLSDLSGPIGGYAYSVKWTGDEDQGGTFSSFIKLQYARNWSEFNSALSDFVAPIHHFTFADKQGNIGSVAPGLFPLRSGGDGGVPAVGWRTLQVWKGWIPYAEVPRSFNPPDGIIVTANNKLVADDYPHHITSDWSPNYRADRIKDELRRLIKETGGKITLRQMQALQMDVQSPSLRNGVLERMQKLRPRTERERAALKVLVGWNGEMTARSPAASLYSSWMSHLNLAVVKSIGQATGATAEPDPSLAELMYVDNTRLIQKILSGGGPQWCDKFNLKPSGDCDGLLYHSLVQAIGELERAIGGDPQQWHWSALHKGVYSHFPFSKPEFAPTMPFVEHSGLSTVFDRQVPATGGNDTVNVASLSYKKETKYLQFFGPQYRQIVELGTGAAAVFSQGTGQSGNPLSAHYDDMMAGHNLGIYSNMNNRAAVQTLTLVPAARHRLDGKHGN